MSSHDDLREGLISAHEDMASLLAADVETSPLERGYDFPIGQAAR